METSTDWRQLWERADKSRWETKSIAELREDAKRGHAVAMYVLAGHLGKLPTPEERKEAMQWRKASAAAGLAQAIEGEALGIYEMHGTPRFKRFKLLEKAAQAGLPSAQYLVALGLQGGSPIRPNPGRAVDLMRAAADAGCFEAVTELAKMYSAGIGEPRNEGEKPIALFLRQAERGDVSAMLEMLFRYRYGLGIPKDILAAGAWQARAKRESPNGFTIDTEALNKPLAPRDSLLLNEFADLFEKGLSQRDGNALVKLAGLHLSGEHGKTNVVRAAALLNLAGQTGQSQAAAKSRGLQRTFDPAQQKAFRTELEWME